MKPVVLITGLILAFSLLLGSYSVVNPGERGIRITMGSAGNTALDEGFHLKLPFFSTIKKISTQVQKTEDTSEAATKDMQRVHASFAINWHLDPSKVTDVYRKVGDSEAIAERIIQPAVSEVLKACTSKMTAEEVLTRRLELKQTIDEMLISRLGRYDILVNDISLVNLDFTTEFNKAVEEKQVAEQNAKKAEYVANQAKADAVAAVNKAHGEADSVLVKARAQADAQKLLQLTVTPAILQLKAIEKWDGSMPQFLGSGGQMLFNIPTKTTKTE